MDVPPDDVVELIFLRLDSAISLLRAASTCKQWHRVAAGAGFLRQFRSLRGQPPVLAGMYYDKPRVPRRRPDFVPSPWADDVVVDGRWRCFSLDFLPESNITPWVWRILDSRGSLLLFGRLRDPNNGRCTSFGDVVICEPVTRRYVRVDPRRRFPEYNVSDASLVDGDSSGGGIGMASFRVVFHLHTRGIHSHAGVFTFTVVGGSDDPQQRSWSWRKVSINALMVDAGPSDDLAPTSLYWYNEGRRVVALDRSTAKFSSLLLPEVEGWNFHKENYDMRVTAGHDGTARIVILDLSAAAGDLLRVFARLSREWALVRSIRLSAVTRHLPGYKPSFFNDTLMIRTDGSSPVVLLSPWQEDKWWFHLDIETMEVAPAPDRDYAEVYPCELPWPPTLRAYD
ncbi:hypothetical protein BDA96_02G180200 [Sorghum bicolor]|uniref:F-box domain-containing protein n=2 Tax=Sorghum bicolor TaxID=4558 RepID=C5X9U2_SORBI|nr:hypothetical protein SORBI_3002G171500 [Sorghum bicolor]KAG0543324.1 hypothetical protein BDA96_02G180200 [Sorghum bicolor]